MVDFSAKKKSYERNTLVAPLKVLNTRKTNNLGNIAASHKSRHEIETKLKNLLLVLIAQPSTVGYVFLSLDSDLTHSNSPQTYEN